MTVLKEKGLSNEAVTQVTGHKNLASVQRYHRKRNNKSYQEMSKILTESKSNENFVYSPEPSSSGISYMRRVHCEEDVVISKRRRVDENIPEDQSPKTVNLIGPFYNCNFSF